LKCIPDSKGNTAKQRVAVALSGGVDSAMAALILLEQGYEVIGLTMSIWDGSIPITESVKSGCFGPGEKDDLASAQAIAAQLGIQHHTIDLSKEYKQDILSYFCSTYLEGKTPNPCVFCNQRMKFGLLPLRARQMGLEFDLYATGHYVRKRYDGNSRKWQLLRALDLSKDQSYFLVFLDQNRLKEAIFPLGEMKKEATKALAVALGFVELAGRKESQDFLESDDHSALFEAGSFTGGDIIDPDGRVLGRHLGLIHYTIGQRKNLGISGQSEPFYVIGIDQEKNRLRVGPKHHLYSQQFHATALSWIAGSPPSRSFDAQCKIRLQHDPAQCRVEVVSQDQTTVTFAEPQLSITPGQIAVIYDKDVVLGGGIIQ